MGQRVASVTQVPSRHSLMPPDVSLLMERGVCIPEARGEEAQTLPLDLRAVHTPGKGSEELVQSDRLLRGPSVLSCWRVVCRLWLARGECWAVGGGRCVGGEGWEGTPCSERADVMSEEGWRPRSP